MKTYRLQIPPDDTIFLSVAPQVHHPDPYANTVASAIRVRRGDRVLDMGCGAGGYGLAAAVRGAGEVVLTDIDPAAVTCALQNAARNGISRVDGRVGSLFAPVRGERFDVIITTLPQLPAPEPILAARYGGPDGLRYLRRLAEKAGSYLAPADGYTCSSLTGPGRPGLSRSSNGVVSCFAAWRKWNGPSSPPSMIRTHKASSLISIAAPNGVWRSIDGTVIGVTSG